MNTKESPIAPRSRTRHLLQCGVAAYQSGRVAEAKQFLHELLRRETENPDALHLLGVIAYYEGLSPVAVAFIRKALQARPEAPEFYTNLALALLAANQSGAALDASDQALTIAPRSAQAQAMRAYVLLRQGRAEEAVPAYRNALVTDPSNASAHSSLLLALQYLHETTGDVHLEEARQWNRYHARGIGAAARPHLNRRERERRLRIGYVSADFRRHSVGYLLDATLVRHDRSAVEVFCYSNHWLADDITGRLSDVADQWRSVVGMSDAEAARLIQEDGIDILVDVSGHTARNRLRVFAYRPAPIQVTWLGYSGTTGLDTMDYIILDDQLCPPGAEGVYSEQVIRLGRTYLAWAPPSERISDGVPPAVRNGHITFGCFNNPTKINPRTAHVWAEILSAIPNARLYLKAAVFDDPAVREHYARVCAAAGIPAERLDFGGKTTSEGVLAHYNRVDIALDPFPYNGCVTTLEALSMGVPVISQRGDYFASRMGSTLLSAVGLGQLATGSSEEYIATAVSVSRDVERLSVLRRELPGRMMASDLCDGQGLARELERAYRGVWRNWCDNAPLARTP